MEIREDWREEAMRRFEAHRAQFPGALGAIDGLVEERYELDERVVESVREARAEGFGWGRIGLALRIPEDAARYIYGPDVGEPNTDAAPQGTSPARGSR